MPRYHSWEIERGQRLEIEDRTEIRPKMPGGDINLSGDRFSSDRASEVKKGKGPNLPEFGLERLGPFVFGRGGEI